MKHTIFILLFIPLLSKSQNETSIISVVIQARDCEYIGYFTGQEDRYEDIDSSLKSKFRPAESAPSGTTNVTVGGATARSWFEIAYRLRREAAAVNGNNTPFTRIDAVLRAVNNPWLTGKLDQDTSDWDATGYTNNRTAGRKRLKRE